MALIHVFKDFLNSMMKIIIIGLTMASLIPFLFFVGSQIDATAPGELQTNKSLDSINDYITKEKPYIQSLDQPYSTNVVYTALDIATATSKNGNIVAMYIAKAEDTGNDIVLEDHSIMFTHPGIYRIRITAVDALGIKSSKKINIVVNKTEVTQ